MVSFNVEETRLRWFLAIFTTQMFFFIHPRSSLGVTLLIGSGRTTALRHLPNYPASRLHPSIETASPAKRRAGASSMLFAVLSRPSLLEIN
jgi:hypothetical protein